MGQLVKMEEAAKHAPGFAQNALRRRWVLLVMVALVSTLVYLNILGNGFVWDDDLQVVRNPELAHLSTIGKAFSRPVWAFLAPQAKVYQNYFRPLHVSTNVLLYQVAHLNPAAYHALSIVLHALAAALVLLIGLRLFASPAAALLAALLFAVHPIHTEAVDWVACYPELQCTVLVLLAFYAWLCWREAKRWPWLAAVAAAYFLGLLAKETAAMLPLVLLAYERVMVTGSGERLRAWPLLKNMTPLAIAAAAYLAVRYWALGSFAPVTNSHELTSWQYVLSILAAIAAYFRQMFLPVPLKAYYVFSPTRVWWAPGALAGVAIVAAGLAALWAAPRFRREWRPVLLGLAWMLITLVPSLALRRVGYNVVAERYVYLPSVGACLLAGALFWLAYARPRWRTAVGTLALVVLLVLGISTVRRNRVWRDDLSFFATAVQASPDATVMHNGLGRVYFARQEFDKSRKEHEAALRAEYRNYRQDALLLSDAYAGMGSAVLALGKAQEAADDFNRALEHFPHHDAFLNLGVIAFQQGDFPKAVALFKRAIRAFPIYDLAYGNAGAALLAEGNTAEAIPYLQHAVELAPANTLARTNLAMAYQKTGKLAEAVAQMRLVVELDPRNETAVQYLNYLVSSVSPGAPRAQ